MLQPPPCSQSELTTPSFIQLPKPETCKFPFPPSPPSFTIHSVCKPPEVCLPNSSHIFAFLFSTPAGHQYPNQLLKRSLIDLESFLSFWVLVSVPAPHFFVPRSGESSAAPTPAGPHEPLWFLFIDKPSLDCHTVRSYLFLPGTLILTHLLMSTSLPVKTTL